MKVKLYAPGYESLGNKGEVLLSSEERTNITRERFAKHYENKSSLVSWYLSTETAKLEALRHLIEYAYQHRTFNVVSFGSGTCVLESLLKMALPKGSRVVALDYDQHSISKAKHFFPEITALQFDFIKGDYGQLFKNLGGQFDLAIFMGSSAAMDDGDLIRVYSTLREVGEITHLIDFCAGYLTWIDCIKAPFKPIKRSTRVRRLLGLSCDGYPGLFHGFGRSRSSLHRTYRKAGYGTIKRLPAAGYKYIAAIRSKG